jgi:hypothetical protein
MILKTLALVRMVMVQDVPAIFEGTQLQPKILKQVKQGSSVCSDTSRGYTGITAKGYVHRLINHSKRQYVDAKGNQQATQFIPSGLGPRIFSCARNKGHIVFPNNRVSTGHNMSLDNQREQDNINLDKEGLEDSNKSGLGPGNNILGDRNKNPR